MHRLSRTLLLLAPVILASVLYAAPQAWPPAAEAANGSWTGKYFNTQDLTGPTVLTRDDGGGPIPDPANTLNFFWDGSPGPGVNPDGWSVRWERVDTWVAGTYRFTGVTDDGMRIFLDQGNDANMANDIPILNGWFNQGPTIWFNDIVIPAGTHEIRVEYYDATNAGTAELRIENVNTLPPGWTGQYWDNINFTGSTFTRNNEPDPNFDWQTGSPMPSIGISSFSARWTRTLDFNEGVYQFFTESDDGSRVYVDGQLILDFWIDQGPTPHTANKQMTSGAHTVVVEYYENAGGASMIFNLTFRPDLGGFVTDTIVAGLNLPTAFAIAPDGRIFIGEKDGTVRIFKNGTVLATPYYTVSPVNNYGDRGLLGLTLDPNFGANGYVYLAYTYDNNPAAIDGLKTAQVIRVNASTPSGDVANGASKFVLLGTVVGTPGQPSCEDWPLTADCIPSDYLSHSVGNLKFGPDGMLYVAVGDAASYSAVDIRALRSQDITRLAGKVLRVNPANGQGLADNPFYAGSLTATRAKVWAYGFRNPFRFNFKPGTNVIFSGDVGWDAWEEQNVVVPGANYGWPCYEGDGVQPGYQAYATCQNLLPGNTVFGIDVYAHPPGAAAVGGAFTGANGYSTAYQNTYFFGDYARNEISTLRVDASNVVVPSSRQVFTSVADGPVQIEVNPANGDVYYLAIITGEVRRIRFVGDNRPPVAMAAATPTSGLAPLTVNFSSAGSNDPDVPQAITYFWDFGDGNTSTLANPSHQYTTNGTKTATLTVTDPFFLIDTASLSIQVGNTAPVATISSPANNSKYDIFQNITFSGSATDLQDVTIPPANLAWSVVMHHCTDGTYSSCHPHTITSLTGTGGSFGIGDHADFVFYEIFLTATDSGGLTHTVKHTITANTVDLTFTSNQAGIQITVGSQAQTVPFVRTVPRFSVQSVFVSSPQSPGASPVYFTAWSDGGAQSHDVSANASATYNATFNDPTPTPTDTPTATNTPTSSPTSTDTATPTATTTPDLPTSTPVPTSTPTDTPTPTNTPVPSSTPTDTPTSTSTSTPTACAGDADCDGILDASDNCPNDANPLQEWSDRNFIDQTPPSTQDDRTWAMSDATGDACDIDDDNDGISDVDEAAGCNGSGALSTTNRDTDGDRTLDGAECTLGTNPGNATSKPTAAQCAAHLGVGVSVDTDGDRIFDRVEYCAYNTDRLLPDTDGDQDAFPLNADPAVNLIKDGCEAASLNNDRAVNSADQLLIALEIAREVDQTLRIVNMDINKDGGVNSGDQLLMAGFIAALGSCP